MTLIAFKLSFAVDDSIFNSFTAAAIDLMFLIRFSLPESNALSNFCNDERTVKNESDNLSLRPVIPPSFFNFAFAAPSPVTAA